MLASMDLFNDVSHFLSHLLDSLHLLIWLHAFVLHNLSRQVIRTPLNASLSLTFSSSDLGFMLDNLIDFLEGFLLFLVGFLAMALLNFALKLLNIFISVLFPGFQVDFLAS